MPEAENYLLLQPRTGDTLNSRHSRAGLSSGAASRLEQWRGPLFCGRWLVRRDSLAPPLIRENGTYTHSLSVFQAQPAGWRATTPLRPSHRKPVAGQIPAPEKTQAVPEPPPEAL